jgi:hypothetical protein
LFHLDLFPCLGIPAGVVSLFPHDETPEAPDLDPVALHQSIFESIKNEIHDPGGMYFG